ncbi:MAG: adenylate/guanylate cyclase domain-containing protein [Verrucomicrobiota bacterium]
MEAEPVTPTPAPPGVQPPGHDRGLVTLLFSDVVGSTALKQALGDRAGVALLQQHHEQTRQVLRDFAGAEAIKTAGDSFLKKSPPLAPLRNQPRFQALPKRWDSTNESRH